MLPRRQEMLEIAGRPVAQTFGNQTQDRIVRLRCMRQEALAIVQRNGTSCLDPVEYGQASGVPPQL